MKRAVAAACAFGIAGDLAADDLNAAAQPLPGSQSLLDAVLKARGI